MCASPAFPRGGALQLNQSLPVNMRLVRRCRISAFVLSALVFLAGLIVLAGWTFAIPALTTFGARGVAMNPLTAACFIVLAGALLLLLPGADPDTERWTARALATVAVTAAVVKLATLGSLNGPDAWMFRASIDATVPVNRMAPNTALIMTMLGVSILVLDVELTGGTRPAPLLVLLAMPITLVVVVGFLFGVQGLYGWGAYIPMSRGSAVAFAALGLAILAGRVEHGVTRIFVSSGSGGVTARRLLPAAVLLPLVIGYARLRGQRYGLYSAEFGVVLFSLAMVAAFSVLIWWTASEAERMHAARADVEVQLQQLIRNVPLGIVVLDLDGRAQLCNDAFVELFHYPASEILGRRIDELIAPRDDEGETASFTSRGSAGENLRRATVRRRRDGELINVEVFVVPLTLRGRPAGTYGLYRDLTGQRRPS
jgi:PAS domain S-box-containing protein